jgi:hypothetical protein
MEVLQKIPLTVAFLALDVRPNPIGLLTPDARKLTLFGVGGQNGNKARKFDSDAESSTRAVHRTSVASTEYRGDLQRKNSVINFAHRRGQAYRSNRCARHLQGKGSHFGRLQSDHLQPCSAALAQHIQLRCQRGMDKEVANQQSYARARDLTTSQAHFQCSCRPIAGTVRRKSNANLGSTVSILARVYLRFSIDWNALRPNSWTQLGRRGLCKQDNFASGHYEQDPSRMDNPSYKRCVWTVTGAIRASQTDFNRTRRTRKSGLQYFTFQSAQSARTARANVRKSNCAVFSRHTRGLSHQYELPPISAHCRHRNDEAGAQPQDRPNLIGPSITGNNDDLRSRGRRCHAGTTGNLHPEITLSAFVDVLQISVKIMQRGLLRRLNLTCKFDVSVSSSNGLLIRWSAVRTCHDLPTNSGSLFCESKIGFFICQQHERASLVRRCVNKVFIDECVDWRFSRRWSAKTPLYRKRNSKLRKSPEY